MKNKKLKILMSSAEISPFAKVGGLADVVGSLPPELKKLKTDVRLIMPLYGTIDIKKYKLKLAREQLTVVSRGRKVKFALYEGFLPGTKILTYFISYPKYFNKKEIYWKNKNSERYLFFSLAVLKAMVEIDFIPDVMHCHDYHSALIPVLIKVSPIEKIRRIKTVYTIHNLNYQGKSDIEVLSTGNLDVNSLHSLKIDSRDGDINFMVEGILNADMVTTVSKTYAKEITTSIYGSHLEKIIRKRKKDLTGVVNGIDVHRFNPKNDNFIYKKYSLDSLSQKLENKKYLQKISKLEVDKNIPLVGFISRFVWQKGIELFNDQFAKMDCQFIFLGTGNPEYEEYLKIISQRFSKKIKAYVMFDLKLAQQIYAGSDLFLMPSRYEPCGLGQMIAMRYGSIPVVRKTGGLVDTVDNKVGFSFKEFSSEELYKTLQKALQIYDDKKRWKALVRNAMKKDFSWKKSAVEYLSLYNKLVKKSKLHR